MPKGIPLTGAEQDRRRHEIFQASVALFLQNGFRETSMQAIARAAGIGKSTLYDYFKTKDEILVSFVEDEIADMTGRALQIASQEIPAAEKLRQVLAMHLEFLAANREVFTRLTIEVQRLGQDSLQPLHQQRHAYQDLLCRLISEATQEGAFRPVNPLLAARSILALLTPAVYTTRPTGTPEQMIQDVLDIFYNGVLTQSRG